jgi:predicted CoA-binding protein
MAVTRIATARLRSPLSPTSPYLLLLTVGPLDRVTMYVRPEVGITLLEAIAKKGCGELWLNPGTDSPELIAKAQELGLLPIVACSLVDCKNRGA